MRIKEMVVSTAVILALSASTAFAVPAGMKQKNEDSQKYEQRHKGREEFEKNPIKALELKKQEIEKLLKEKRITKEEAQEKINKIDAKIKEIKEFDKLSVQQKKEKLIKDCEARLNKMMANGKIDQQTAEQMFRDYVERINNWDGSGYPMFHGKSMKDKHR